MKFRYYISDVMSYSTHGTNDLEVAEMWAETDEAFVVDSHTGLSLNSEGVWEPIEETGEC